MADHSIRIVLYTQQEFVAYGLAAIANSRADLELAACRNSLAGTLECLRSAQPDVLVVHLISGISLAELREIRAAAVRSRIVLWGQDLGGEFAYQALHLGVRSILPDNTSIDDFLATLRNVHRGALCFDRELMESVLSQQRIMLTPRQGQIVSLVAQGYKNKEIAFALGITEGTVKVYLYKLFKKLGVNDRLDLALYGRRHLFGGQPGLERTSPPGPTVQFPGKPAAPSSILLVARKQPGVPVVH